MFSMHKRGRMMILTLAAAALVTAGGIIVYPVLRTLPRSSRVVDWIRHPEEHPTWAIRAGERCGNAPFQFPTSGYIGFVWGDSFRLFHRHSGVDIFGGSAAGITPVMAVYDGYVTRLTEWKASLIQRIPSDPLQPDRQIWVYYTHLADPQGQSLIDEAFPPGTEEKFVQAGALLGWQGNYSGRAGAPVGVHLHVSVVKDDGQGKFLDERLIENTLDPSPYFGLELNATKMKEDSFICQN